MRKAIVLLSLVVILLFGFSGCSFLEVYSGQNSMVGTPIPEERLEKTPSHLRALIVNDSNLWVATMGYKKGRQITKPFSSTIVSFNRKGMTKGIAHAWHDSYLDKNGKIRFRIKQDFAGETGFTIFLGNNEKMYYGEKYGDIITFTNSSFYFDPLHPYPRRYLHGDKWWQNFCIGEYSMGYP